MVAILYFPPHTGGNSRTCPGSSVVGVAYLLGGAAWYAALGASGGGGVFPEGAAVAGLPRFVDLPLLALCFFFFFCLWACCAARPSVEMYPMLAGCFGIQSGKTLFR